MATPPASADEAPALRAETIAEAITALGVSLPSQAPAQLAQFAALLRKWSAVHNLTAIHSAQQVLTHHLLDCLAVLPTLDALAERSGRDGLRLLDVGAGGGLPGLPLAIARPQHDVTLVDKVAKKVAFISQVQLDLRLPNVHAIHSRVEALHMGPLAARGAGPFDLITSRAFAALPAFIALTQPLLAPGGHWLALKGPAYTSELEGLPEHVRLLSAITLTIPHMDEQRYLLTLQLR